MFTPATDYNRQLLAYLQTWRQLLEQWTAMTAGLPFPTAPFAMPTAPPGAPFIPPTMPIMPPMPPAASVAPRPPAPGDYIQQLFGYLQAWRQYLEQMTGARPGSPQASTAQPAYEAPNRPVSNSRIPHRTRPPDVPVPPHQGTGSKNLPGSDKPRSSKAARPLMELAPDRYISSQVTGTASAPAGPFDHGLEGPQILSPPDYDFGYRLDPGLRLRATGPAIPSAGPETSRYTPEAPVEQPIGSPFRGMMERLEPEVSPQLSPKSLFSAPGAQAASPKSREAGEAPPS
jgi:hypothetical protein